MNSNSKTRLLKSFFFTLSIIFSYLFLFFIRRFLPFFTYSRVLNSLNQRTANRIKKFCIKTGGIFIKFGQFLSVIANIISPESYKTLKELQDKVPPRDFDSIRPIFIKCWGKEPEGVLDEFDKTPIASASLAQVYKCKYKNKYVAVKVLYPDIKDITKNDLFIISFLLRVIHFFFPSLNTEDIYPEFERMILREIDFDYEKKNLEEIRKALKGFKDVIIPNYIKELSVEEILVTEFVDGYKVDNIDGLKSSGLSLKDVSRRLLEVYSFMIFNKGFFHSDPHPGNIIINKDNKIGIIDFGSSSFLNRDTIIDFRKLLKAFISKDYSFIVQHLEYMGFIRADSDKEKLENIFFYIVNKLDIFNIKDYQNMTLDQIYRIYNLKNVGVQLKEFLKYIQLPQNYVFFIRTIGLLIGVVSKLDRDVNVIQILLPYLKKFLLGQNEKLKDVIKREIKENVYYISQTPESLYRALETINSGKVKISFKEFKKGIDKIYLLGHQLIYSLFLIASVFLYYFSKTNNQEVFSNAFYYSSLFFLFMVLLSFVRKK